MNMMKLVPGLALLSVTVLAGCVEGVTPYVQSPDTVIAMPQDRGRDKAPLAQSLGLRVAADSSGLTVKNVLRGGAGEAAGLAAGDEWLGVEFAPARRGLPAEAWRVRKLDEVAALRGTRSALTALVSRDGRLLRCPLTWPADDTAVRLTVEDAARLGHWLTRSPTG